MASVRRGLALMACCALVAGSHFAAAGTPRHGVSIFGELKYPPGFQHFDYVNPDAPKGGTLVLATSRNFNSFTPFLPKGMVAGALIAPGVLYDGLMVRADDELHTFYANLAQSVVISNDFRSALIRLNPKARWHDGVPVTAKDVKFTFEFVLENASSGVRNALRSLEAVEILGERELVLHFRKVVGLNAAAVSMLSYVNILPEHYWRHRDMTRTTLEPPLGSGPYRIADFVSGRFILYERVPDYWGRDLPVHRGRHNFDFLRYDFYRDGTIRREAFRKGLLDYHTEYDGRYWRTAYDIPAREKGWILMRKHNRKMNAGFVQTLAFNTRRERLADVRVREALTVLFDFQWSNRVLYHDYYTRAESYFANTVLAAEGLPSVAELALLEPFRDELPALLFTEPFRLPRTSGHGFERDNVRHALALFADSGWTIKGGVMVNGDDRSFELDFLSASAAQVRTLLPYIDQLKRLGIEARMRVVEASQYINLLGMFDFDALLRGHAIGFPPSLEILAYFDSRVARVPHGANLAGIESRAVDALVAAALNAKSLAELTAAGRALDRVLLWGYYHIPMIGIEPPHVIYWDKFGRPPIDAEYRTSFPDAWWWDEARASRIRDGLATARTD